MWETIGFLLDWTLRVTGAISICWHIIKSFFPNNEYIDNIVIKEIQSIDEAVNLDLHFFEVFKVNPCMEGQYFVIYPVNADIKELRIIEVEYNGRRLVNKKVLKTYKDITNNRGVVINTIVPDTIPFIKIEWNMGKGLKGEYPISFNGFNGNTNIVSYRYENNILRVINRIFK
ncbi:hypothetical protein [Ruoffia sp. FAM 26254]|uniref:hypothetical protein n=1 Tax=Ruoffia sp. FAM 26254 TaxID=3259518 RepID=UPI00388387AB